MSPISIVLVEDHHLVRAALVSLIERDPRFAVVGQAEDGNQALELAERLSPEIVVMDIMMPNLNGFEATARLRGLLCPPQVVILSQYNSPEYVVQAVQAGAKAYLLKDAAPQEFALAVEAVMAGETYFSAGLPRAEIEERMHQPSGIRSDMERLTSREREVLQLVVEGNTNRQIAHHLGISIKTVEKHRFSLMEKLHIRDVTGLVRFAVTHGIIADGNMMLLFSGQHEGKTP